MNDEVDAAHCRHEPGERYCRRAPGRLVRFKIFKRGGHVDCYAQRRIEWTSFNHVFNERVFGGLAYTHDPTGCHGHKCFLRKDGIVRISRVDAIGPYAEECLNFGFNFVREIQD